MNRSESKNRRLDLPDDNFVSIEDDEISPDQLMEMVRARMQTRDWSNMRRVDLAPYGSATEVPAPPNGVAYDFDLFRDLRHLNRIYFTAETEPVLVDSPSTSVPIFGSIWKLIRRQMHELVLFYVNRGVTHQIKVDDQMVRVLNSLVRTNLEQQQEIDSLRQELHTLKASVALIKSSGSDLDSGSDKEGDA